MVPAPLTGRELCAIIVGQIQETLRAQAITAPDLYCPDLVSGSRTVCMVVKWRWLSVLHVPNLSKTSILFRS